jgi:secretion/DNA translocation related CpaE-like protein
MQPRSLVVTEDLLLLDDVLRLAAVAGIEPEVTASSQVVRARWRSAPVVVVGADWVARCAALGLARRPGVLLVAGTPPGRGTYAAGIEVGVAEVVELPAAEQRLAELLAGARSEPAGPPGSVMCVLSGCGGGGASVLSAALACVAASTGRSPLLVDADPFGGGVDLLLGGETAAGLRWPDLASCAGPISPGTLRDALPRVHGVSVLATARKGPMQLPAAALRAVLHAGRRFADPVVLDLSRSADAGTAAVLDEADRALLVVPNEVRAVAAAARMAEWAGQHLASLDLVVRRVRPHGLAAEEVAGLLGLPLAGSLRPEPGLAGALERGEPPGRRGRGPLAGVCHQLLAGLPVRAAA